jgi:hypothetical protein
MLSPNSSQSEADKWRRHVASTSCTAKARHARVPLRLLRDVGATSTCTQTALCGTPAFPSCLHASDVRQRLADTAASAGRWASRGARPAWMNVHRLNICEKHGGDVFGPKPSTLDITRPGPGG